MADWYYARNNQQVGPVSDDDMHRLAEEGNLRPGDLVWRDGLAEWVPAESQGFAGGRSARGTAEDDYDRPRRARGDRGDRDDDYRPRRRSAKKKGPSTGLIVGLSVGGVVLLIGIIVGVVLLINSGGGGGGGDVGPGTYHGVLTGSDRRDTRMRGPCHIYNLKMTAGRTYVIDHMTNQFDAYLRLENAAGIEVARDDDGGVGLNSKIIFRAPNSGTYRLIATSLGAGRGAYTLTIIEN